MPIQKLHEDVVTRIAAGEVIERPASVVKEMLENSIDAEARYINVEILNGGQRLIRISDDGIGISNPEVELAFARHATSKLNKAEDLDFIHTLGFRGEALSSIAAVSVTRLMTRHRDEESGTQISIQGGKVESIKSIGAPAGTVISVENLFFNTPARLKFLKTQATEKRHIYTLVSQYAMAYPHIRFVLTQDKREQFRSSGSGQLSDVLVQTLGIKKFEHMIEIESEEAIRNHDSKLRLHGFVSNPALSRKDRSEIILFINGRLIQDHSLSYAVVQAYHLMLPKGQYPYAVLLLEMPTEYVDVNVHPAKAEVRFQDKDLVYLAVQRSIRQAVAGTVDQIGKYASNYTLDDNPRKSLDWWDNDHPNESEARPSHPFELDEDDEEPIERSYPRQKAQKARTLPVLRVIGQIAGSYIITEGPAGMYLIDQHFASHRVLYERMLDQLQEGQIESQEITPLVLELSSTELRIIETFETLFQQLGILIEVFGTNMIRIRKIPQIWYPRDTEMNLEHLFRLIVFDQSLSEENRLETLTKHVSGLGAYKNGQALEMDKMRQLVQDLERCQSPKVNPFDKPTLVYFSADELENAFSKAP